MLTKEDFANFVLKAKFRANPEVNSGMMLRNPRPSPAPADGKKKGGGGGQGYELQIRDRDSGHYSGGSYLTGSIVNVQKAPEDAKIKPGEWNTVQCTMNHDHMIVIYNGRTVVDAHDSKLKNGAIGLQLAHPEDARRRHRISEPEDQTPAITSEHRLHQEIDPLYWYQGHPYC